MTLIDSAPAHIFLSPAFPSAFQSVLTALTLPSVRVVITALDAIRAVVGHDALEPNHASPDVQAFAPPIRAVVESTAQQSIPLLLDVLVGGGEDEPYNVLTILRLLSVQFPTVLASTVPPAVELLPARAASPAEKADFLQRFTSWVASVRVDRYSLANSFSRACSALTAMNPNQVKDAFTWLLRTSRKSRDRARELGDRAA